MAVRKKKAAVVCANFHTDRSAKRDRDWLQPSAGLQIASQIDQEKYDVILYHEMWHGSYGLDVPAVDIVFLTGLQKDFDRQRQLAYLFKRKGAITVAGGSICTIFPQFASEFFDVVCSGGVDSVSDVMSDHENGTLRSIYLSPQTRLTEYPINYQILTKNGIGGGCHLVEASRGCNFQCDFCAIPAEQARHTKFGTDRVIMMIDDAIDTSPRLSIKRLFPMVSFIDNNFTNDRSYARELCAALKAHRRLRVWGALVTQEVLKDHDLVSEMARSKCRLLFTGIESLDQDFLRAHNKRQNVKHSATLFEDVAFARDQGIIVVYGYLLDPRMSTTEEMAAQLRSLLNIDALTYPSFISVVSPLLGTRLFWESAERGELRPNLRLRDLDGMSFAYTNCRNSDEELSQFARTVFQHTDQLVSRRQLIRKSLRSARMTRRPHPVTNIFTFVTNLRVMREMKNSPPAVRNYLAGQDILDPQYGRCPSDISPEDRYRYFDPIYITDGESKLQPWLEQYRPVSRRKVFEGTPVPGGSY